MIDCPYFGECGSCTLDMTYNDQLDFKLDFIKSEFGEFFNGEFELFGSNPHHYRNRAEFGIWHEDDKISYTMNSKNHTKISINECLKVDVKIAQIMQPLLSALSASESLRQRLFGVEFISTSENLVAILLYHKNISNFKDLFDDLAKTLKISIIARSRGVKLVSGYDQLFDELKIGSKIYRYTFSDGAFIQPNKSVNEKMIGWAKGCVSQSCDLLELYCGHGNFTIALADRFDRVLATEISKSSIANALRNCDLNEISNIKFLRMDADELMSAFAGQREFNRLKDVNLSAFNFSHILVDPPRAGLSQKVVNFINGYKNIIYISCNPATLKQNLTDLIKTHEVAKFAIFDQFANTHHIECGVLLRRKSDR